jgi:hypothetical protein
MRELNKVETQEVSGGTFCLGGLLGGLFGLLSVCAPKVSVACAAPAAPSQGHSAPAPKDNGGGHGGRCR